MRFVAGDVVVGVAGKATEVFITGRRPSGQEATVATWFLDCPGQSPAWRHYVLGVIHLRSIDGVPPAHIHFPGATHEVLIVALDPAKSPTPTNVGSWSHLYPVNVCQQVTIPDDDAARELARLCAMTVVEGVLPAEPALAGAVEPWRTALVKTSAHLRGEEHAS